MDKVFDVLSTSVRLVPVPIPKVRVAVEVLEELVDHTVLIVTFHCVFDVPVTTVGLLREVEVTYVPETEAVGILLLVVASVTGESKV